MLSSKSGRIDLLFSRNSTRLTSWNSLMMQRTINYNKTAIIILIVNQLWCYFQLVFPTNTLRRIDYVQKYLFTVLFLTKTLYKDEFTEPNFSAISLISSWLFSSSIFVAFLIFVTWRGQKFSFCAESLHIIK